MLPAPLPPPGLLVDAVRDAASGVTRTQLKKSVPETNSRRMSEPEEHANRFPLLSSVELRETRES